MRTIELRVTEEGKTPFGFTVATNTMDDIKLMNKIRKSLAIQVDADVKPDFYEPYYGWCDVWGCKNEGCSGGNAWRDTGYWTVCSKHADDCRAGKPQPKMKQKSIKRENSRDKKTGCLPSKNSV